MSVASKYHAILLNHDLDWSISQGKSWYPYAWDTCVSIGTHFGVAPRRVAAVMAVTSPRARWSVNKAVTRAIISDVKTYGGVRSEYRYNVLPANVLKANTIMTSRYYRDVISGPKVSAFFDAICGNEDVVVVDSLMSKAAGFGVNVTDRIRSEVTLACYTIGDVLDICPRDAQAAVWCAYRESAV